VKLVNILRELEYGKRLFADPNPQALKADSKKRAKFAYLIGNEPEPNTEDENEFLLGLRSFTKATIGQGVDIPSILVSNAPKLLSLKSKFPKILDPLSSSSNDWITAPRGKQLVLRGATIPRSTFEKINWNDYVDLSKYEFIAVPNPGLEVAPRSQRGVHSFTIDPKIAYNFLSRQSRNDPDRVPIIIGISADNPNFVFNPDFVNTISNFTEDEVLYVGNTFKPDFFILPDDMAYFYKIGPYEGGKGQGKYDDDYNFPSYDLPMEDPLDFA
jgi:hypothetical protein